MDRSRQETDSDRRQDPTSYQNGGAVDLTVTFAALDGRLDHLERTTTAFAERLQAIEEQLKMAAPRPVTLATATTVAWEPATVSLPPSAVPQPGPVSRKRDVGSLQAAAHAVLDGQPATGQPRPSSRARTVAPQPSPLLPGSLRAGPRPRLSLELAELERAVSGRGLAWAGGLALLLGALFFLSLAISRGWIGPEARVVIGLVAGLGITALGDRLLRGGDRVLGPVLVAVGIGIWNLALVAGTRLYDFVPLWAALMGAAAGALVAGAIAIRANAQIIALYGMVTALAAPMLFEVPAARTPMAYLVVILAGATAIAIGRGWSWLPPVAFVLAEGQFFSWWLAARAPDAVTLLAIVSLSLLHLIAATGVALRARTERARPIAALLLLLNAAAFTVVGFGTLGDERIGLGVYLVGAVAAHAALGRFVLAYPAAGTAFAGTALAIAITLLTIAVPVVFDGPAVAIAWAAEAVGLVWLAQRYRSADGFVAAAIVYALAVWHLFSVEYGSARLESAAPTGQGIPFANAAGLTLLALLAALAAVGVVVRTRLARMTCAVIGFGLVIAALPYELSGLSLLAGWALLAVLALTGERLGGIAPEAVSLGDRRAWFAANGLKLPAALAGALAVHRAVAYEMPVLTAVPIEAGVPYVGQPVAAAAIIVLAALAAMVVTVSDEVREIAGSVAILIAAHLAAFELDPAPAVAVWSVLAVGAWALHRQRRSTIPVYLATTVLLLTTGLLVAFGDIAPPARLLLTGGAHIDHPFLWSEATLALGALSLALFVISWASKGTPPSAWLALGGGVLALYLLSIGIVDEFQRRVDGEVGVAELRRQSQVVLSVVWAVLGGVIVVAGLVRPSPPLRWFGLGLLALTTGKVFLYDLASLDAVYRVLSFIVLGVLLLLSAYAYRRLGASTESDGRAADGVAPASVAGEPR